MSTIALLAGWLLVSIALQILIVWCALRIVRVGKPTLWRSVAIVLLTSATSIAISLAEAQIGKSVIPVDARDGNRDFIIWSLFAISLVINLLAVSLIVKFVAATSFWRGALAGLLFVVFGGALGIASVFPVKAYVLEAFVIPTNSMAPTIVGWHRIGACGNCGGELMVPASAPDDDVRFIPVDDERDGTCPKCGHFGKSTTKTARTADLLGPDRIVVNKLLQPQRWDMIVFRYPRDPRAIYINRLVGLPGEKVFLEDGAVWIDDVKQPLPESVGKWRYAADFGPERGPTDMGSREKPWVLNDDEYCVLGDFGWNSNDSRTWGTLPTKNFVGVATTCYWPPSRWKIWR